jgi:hypothetical protein
MANKIKVLTNLTASQDVIVKGNVIISGSKQLSSDSAFNKAVIVTSSGGMYDMNGAIHAVDTSLTTLKNNIKDAYNLVRTVLTGTLDVNGNKKINLTTTITSGSLYFSTSSLTSVEASVLIDENEDSVYKNDLVSLQLYNSASYLWVEIDAPIAINDSYNLIVKNQLDFPINGSVGGGVGGGAGGSGGGHGGGGTGGGGSGNLFIIAPIVTPTGSIDDSVSGSHEGYYIYPDISGNVTIVVNDFSASVSDGGLAFYVVPNNYTGTISYDTDTDVINSNDIQRIITLKGTVNNTTYDSPYVNNTTGPNIYVYGPHATSSINSNTMTITIPVGTGSSVYVDAYSNSSPTTYDFDWSGGTYNNYNSNISIYVSTSDLGGYWVGASTGDINNVITDTLSGTIRGTQFVSATRIKPPNVSGKTLLNVIVRWYGGADVAANNVYDPNDYYSPRIGDSAPAYLTNGTGIIDNKYHWNAWGGWDQDNYSNPLQISTWFNSAASRQGYAPNYDFSTQPIVVSKGGGLQGIGPDGTYDGFRGGELVIVTLGITRVEWEFIYG